jgi:hypothetical protein
MRQLSANLVRVVLASLIVSGFACKKASTTVDAGPDVGTVPDAAYPDRAWLPNPNSRDAGVVSVPSEPFRAVLTGGAVTPPVDGVTSSGSVDCVLNSAKTELVCTLHFDDPQPVIGHIHLGAPGETGPAVVQLNPPTSGVKYTMETTPDFVSHLEAGDFYVDIHTRSHLHGGALRGQLLPPDQKLYEARMNGAESVTPHASAVTASVFVELDENTYDYWTTYTITGGAAASVEVDDLSGHQLFTVGQPQRTKGTASLTSQIAAIQAGQIVVKLVVQGTNEELGGTLAEPGSKLLVATPTAAQVRPTPAPPLSGNTASARFLVNYLQDHVKSVITTSAVNTSLRLLPTSVGAAGAPLLDLQNNLIMDNPLSTVARDALFSGKAYLSIGTAVSSAGELWGQVSFPGEQVFVAPLSASEITPPVAAGTGGAGAAWAFLGLDGKTVRYFITTAGLPVANVYVEEAMPTTPASSETLRVKLVAPANEMTGTFPAFTSDPSLLTQRLWRLRVTTQAHPDGELAGQFRLAGESLYVARLTGGAMAPASVTTGNSGVAFAAVNAARTQVAMAVLTTTTPIEVDFCNSLAGTVAQAGTCNTSALAQPATSKYWLTTGSSIPFDSGIPSGLWYVQVPTSSRPNGELRGQLLAPGERIYVATLSGRAEVPAVSSLGAGNIALVLNATQDGVRYSGSITGLLAAEPANDGTGNIFVTVAQIGVAPPGQPTYLSPLPILLPDLGQNSDATVLYFGGGSTQNSVATLGMQANGFNPVDAVFLQHLTKQPASDYAVEVLTGAYPHGEIRGSFIAQ